MWTGEADPRPTRFEPGEPSVAERLILSERDDFPCEQSRDETQKNAFEQVCSIDGQSLQPARTTSYPYFAILKNRLYRVIRDTPKKQATTQLLIPKAIGKCFSRRLIVIPWQDIWEWQQH